MPDLHCSYLGLSLKNPLIVGSCRLSGTADGVSRLAEAGAGAVVLKSIFEEQIRLEYEETTQALAQSVHPEALAYLEADVAAQYGPRQVLTLIREAKERVSIPVIGSINCVSAKTWTEFARQMAGAGADALELNLYVLPTGPEQESAAIEQIYLDAVASVTRLVSIPVAVKLAPYLTNPGRIAHGLTERGAAGLVLFNRLFHPDVDVDAQVVSGGISLSSQGEHRIGLRWIALLYERLATHLCAARGIHDGRTAIKMILAGATAFQVTSALYRKGNERIGEILQEMTAWMEEHGYERLADFRGALSRAHIDEPEKYERAQYIKAFVGVE